MPRSEQTAPDDGISERDLAFFGRVRDLRAEIQNIQKRTAEIKTRSELMDPEIREREMRSAIIENERLFRSNREQIEALIREVRGLLQASPQLYDFYGDQVANIENDWEVASSSWPDPNQPNQILQRVTRMQEALRGIVRCSGQLTIPNRVRQHLKQQRIGGRLNFHEFFSDELPELEDRMQLLRYMHSHPAILSGVVSVEEGVIYSASPNRWRQRASLWFMLAAALFGFVVIWGAKAAGMFPEDMTLRGLNAAYGMTLAGAVAHVLVDFLKRDRAGQPVSSGLHDWLLQIHVKELSFLQAAVSLWFGFLLMAYFLPETIGLDTAFFLGYSIDSFMDLFLQRFTKTVTAGTQALQKRVEASGG